MGKVNPYYTAFLPHMEFAGRQSTNAKEFNAYIQGGGECLICQASVQLVQH